jgi:hypothetical protein
MASHTFRVLSSLGLALLLPGAAAAWTPGHHLTIAWEAARLAPRDLYRQILRHKEEFEAGVLAPGGARACEQNPDGSGAFDKTAVAEAEGAVRAIRDHRPFAEVVRRLGRLTRCLAWANNPLSMGEEDAEEARYAADFARYVESAEPRFPLLFYGLRPSLDRAKDLSPLLAETVKRGRAIYPRIGDEYRRIDFASGIGRFDDRSTAFGVASVSFSRSITDAALALRFVWLRAGGADPRTSLPRDGSKILQLNRAGRPG